MIELDIPSLIIDRFRAGVRPQLGTTQRGLAIGGWMVSAALALWLNRSLDAVDRSAVLYFSLLHTISVLLALRLPGGAYVGMLHTTLVAALLVLGYRPALLVPVLTSVLILPLAILIGTLSPVLHSYRGAVFFEALYYSGLYALGLLPTGWLYERLGGPYYPAEAGPQAYLVALACTVLYFLLTAAGITLWVRLNGASLRQFWLGNGQTVVITGLLIVIPIAPLLAERFAFPSLMALLEIIPFALATLLLYLITHTHLSLSDRVADLRALNNIAQTLNARLELEDLLTAIYNEISRLLDASNFYLALYDEPSQTLHFVMEYEDGQRIEGGTRPFSNGLTEYVIRTRRPLLLPRDVYRRARRMGIEPLGSRSRCYLGVPVLAGERAIGVMAIRSYTQEYAYDADDLRLLETIASAAGIALQNAWLYRQSQRQASELSTLNRVSALVGASLNLEEVIGRLCQIVVEVMGCQKSAVFLLDEDKKIMQLVGSVGLGEAYHAVSTRIDARQSKRAMALRSGEAIAIADVRRDERLDPTLLSFVESEGIQSLIDVPLRSGDEITGILTAYWDRPRRFEPNEVELLQTLGGQVAIAVQNARLYEDLRARHSALETLYEASRILNASLSVSSVLRTVAESLNRVLGTEMCIALLADEGGQNLRAELWLSCSGGGVVEHPTAGQSISLSDLPRLARAIREGDVLVLQPTGGPQAADKRRLMGRFGLASGIGLPLVVHDELIGLILTGTHASSREFDRATLRLAHTLANQAAAAIQNARLFERTDVALKLRLEELSALEAISQRMTRHLDLHAVISQVAEAAMLATEAEMAEIALLDTARNQLVMEVRRGLNAENPIDKTWPADEGLTGRALRLGEAVCAADVSQEPDYIAARPEVRSELAVPIILDGRPLGVINLESTRLDAFRPEHSRFVTNLAEHAAIAIENARLFETVERRAREFQTLRAIAVELLSAPDLQHSLHVIAREALKHTRALDVHIYLYDQATGTLTFGTSLWTTGEIDREFARPRPHGITATAARTGERLVITNPKEHPLFADVQHLPIWDSVQAMVSVPLKRGNEVIGVFNIAFGERTNLTDDTLHFLDLLAAQAAVAIANARLADETRLSRDRLQAILDSVTDGILVFDRNGQLVLANPRVEALLGIPAAEHIGQSAPWVLRRLARRFSGDQALALKETAALVRRIRETPDVVMKRRYVLSTPTMRAIEETSVPVKGDDGEILGHLFILHDVTQEYELEAYRQEVSHMIVHDLRSPLAGVITGLDLASEELAQIPPDPHRDTVRATVEVALISANALLRLVEQILDVNQLEAGEVPLLREPLDLKALAEETVQVLRGTAAEANITLIVRAPPDLSPVSADADKIKRVFFNLLDNALRYTPEGGEIRIDIIPRPDHYEVVVTDTGEGVPPDFRERIFERFVQGNVLRRKRGPKGSGLGLTFCKLAVEAHGGRIWVDDGPEGGAAFHFTLPLTPPPDG